VGAIPIAGAELDNKHISPQIVSHQTLIQRPFIIEQFNFVLRLHPV
jgi:arsenate reductase-like glutaredoxin family protein